MGHRNTQYRYGGIPKDLTKSKDFLLSNTEDYSDTQNSHPCPNSVNPVQRLRLCWAGRGWDHRHHVCLCRQSPAQDAPLPLPASPSPPLARAAAAAATWPASQLLASLQDGPLSRWEAAGSSMWPVATVTTQTPGRVPSFFQFLSCCVLWNVKKYGDLALDILPSTENVLQPPAAVCLSPSLASDAV